VPHPLRVAIVDDEPLAREGLRIRLAAAHDLEVVAECGDATEAVAMIGRTKPDVCFLDVQMPELDGFALAERLERGLLPAVIFVTAYEQHALRAFRVGAIDYLVKPFDDETLHQSVERARAYVESLRRAPPAVCDGAAPITRLMVRHEGRVLLVDAASIDWLESQRDHVRVHSCGREYLVRSTLQALEARLDPARFVRVHRTAIVAIAAVRALQPYSRGEYLVVLADGKRLPLSRRYRARVIALLRHAAPG
jgi:two-component system LytT family response regulator